MDHAAGVSSMHGPRERLDEPGRRPRRLWRPLEVLSQTATRHELQDEIRPARGLADVVDLNNVRMLQASDHLGFGAETGQVLRADVGSGQDHLHRHRALQGELPGLIDDAHAAAAQLPQHFVAGHGRQFGPGAARHDVSRVRPTAGRASDVIQAVILERRPHPLQTRHDPFFGVGTLGGTLGAPPCLRIRRFGQVAELIPASAAPFHVPREVVPFLRGQRVCQQI
jgi:hypothetical protein